METQNTARTVHQALDPLRRAQPTLQVSWILDAGFDDIAVWRTIWEEQEHLVVRLKAMDRQVAIATGQGAVVPSP